MKQKLTQEQMKERAEQYVRIKLAGVTMIEVAKALGCSKQWVSKHFNGHKTMTAEMQSRMIQFIEQKEKENGQ